MCGWRMGGLDEEAGKSPVQTLGLEMAMEENGEKSRCLFLLGLLK